MSILNKWKGLFESPEKEKVYASYLDKWEEKIGSFLAYDLKRNKQKKEGPLCGVPFGVKDNITVTGMNCTCGSKILEDFVSPYTATAVKRLEEAGAFVVGKMNLDEFGMGSSTENSGLKETSNPWDPSRVAGGSSGGSAASVAAGLVPFALGSDTGGSIRQPGAFCGVYGLKPTYGSVSRFGLVAYASSLEVIGVLSRDVDTARTVFNTMKGIDEQDQTSVAYPSEADDSNIKSVGVIEGLTGLSKEVEDSYNETIENLKKQGYEIKSFKMPTLEYVVPTYYTIAMAEASANLARYTGIRYGYRPDDAKDQAELIKKARSYGFGHEVKLRVLLGTYVLRSGFQDQYYNKAQKIRTAIRNDFDNVFSSCDLIMMPVFPTQAFKKGSQDLDQFQQKLADKFTVAANLAGIPAMSFPAGVKNGLPIGMQFLAPLFKEERIFKACEKYAEIVPIQNPPGFQEVV